ncbi:MAG: glycoside hydrolase family 25 protein [Saprospiraceae bacterium]|nr:glycoside hydrolase family 25 protein [Saprospiraceae bacterium]
MATRKAISPQKKKSTRPAPKRRQGTGRLSATNKEKRVILGSTIVVLLVMVSLHLSGCFNELKASKFKKSYIKFPEFGISLPTFYDIHGIDVSVHQGLLNWKILKETQADNVKFDFAFIKATEGRTMKDRYFNHNWRQAKKYDFIRGAYHYLLPNKSGKDQADFFLKTVELEEGDLVPVCDIEITAGMDKATIEKNLQEWLDTIEEVVGKKPIIYTSKKFYESYLSDKFSDYPLWIAHYYVSGLDLEDNSRWIFWQHNDRGKVKGIAKRLDFNVFNGTMDELNLLRI